MKSSLVPTPAPPPPPLGAKSFLFRFDDRAFVVALGRAFPRATKKALSSKRNKKDDELSAFMEKDKIRSLDEICQNINNLENTTMKVVFPNLKRADNTVK